MKKINFINILLLVFVKIVFCQSLYNGTGHIPTSSQINWYKAGLLDKSQETADFILKILQILALYLMTI